MASHRYVVSVSFLVIIVIYFVISTVLGIVQKANDIPTMTDENGNVQPVTIEEVKRSIAEFQDQDPQSNEK